MSGWTCSVCGYVYSKEKGEPATETPPGTSFSDLPDTWTCPVCGAAKSAFILVEEEDALHEASGNTVSDALISEREAGGVTLVFGLPGTSSPGLVDAIRKNPNLRYIVVRHEENAAMAASAYNKLTGKMAVCLTIAGPGATNLSTGLYDAKEDGASVLSLNGQVESQYTGPHGTQEIDRDAFFRTVSVCNNTVYERNKAILLLDVALKYATLHHGVAQVPVPNEIQKQLPDRACCRKEICIASPHIVPDGEELAKAAAAIEQAENPVIIAGWGACGEGAAPGTLAEKIKAPILTTFRAKGVLPEGHPRVAGVLGSVGSPQARPLANDADLLITFGAGFSKFTNVSTDKALIQMDTSPVRLGRGPRALSLWGNCALTIPKLTGMVKVRDHPEVLPRISQMKWDWQEQLDREADATAIPVRPPYIMKVLSETVPGDAVITVDVGENQWWFGRNFRMKRQRSRDVRIPRHDGVRVPGGNRGKDRISREAGYRYHGRWGIFTGDVRFRHGGQVQPPYGGSSAEQPPAGDDPGRTADRALPELCH